MNMKIGLVQFSPVWENKKASSEKIIKMLANTDKVDLLIFPEMSLTGFTMKSNDFAESLEGESYQFFAKLAKVKKCSIMFGMIERGKKKIFNTLIHLNNQGKIITIYRKIHPFSYTSEDAFYGAGKEIAVTKSKGYKIGLSICYDLRFPELYRLYAKEKVHIIIDIANWPSARIEHWRTLLKARAIENQCYMVGVNRVDNDPALSYNGFSSAFDPMGNLLVEAADVEQLILAEVEKKYVVQVRNKLPFLKDMKLI
jgi:predicted amidohydrolase